MTKVLFYGSGAIAREIYDFELMNRVAHSDWSFVGYINDFGADADFESNTGMAYYGSFAALNDVTSYHYLICVADPKSRALLLKNVLETGCQLFKYIHSTALIARTASVADGCILYPYVVISANASLGKCVIVNTYSGVGHDVSIGECSTLSAHVDLTGNVKVGYECFFGTGARVVPNKKIGNHSSIGAGVTVIRSIKDNHLVMPSPNKIIDLK
jgi:sugar O-acyltransferase (sialic acid O-acetyltransferase NeuD family)